ncbi:MAG: tripartite tricarboxylate transporter substrate binding protein [Burkholderiales bacterium]|nr:tripartite tricarboxylate transporter substrate binding protein [Burkholderiales bacterium]MCW5604206.1 tripartite tricarboxylate transporter substrate binding protein [Burkholderiales bacterium]
MTVIARACTAAVLALAAPLAAAQNYPAKPLRIINPLAAGGNVDIVARGVAEQLSRTLGQQVLVENRPGASALVGTRYVRGQPADGYTFLAIANTFARVPAIVRDPGYDPLKDFTGVTLTCDIPMVLVVNPALPVKNLKEFIALAKKRPGDLTYGSAGTGGTGHVAAEMFSQQAGIRLMHIPYKGNAPATTDLVGGQIMLMFDQVSTSAQYIRAGRLRGLAVTTKKRSPVFPDIPTIDEAGVRGFEDSTFNGLVAPAGTPREMLEKIRGETVKAVAVPALKERFDRIGIPLVASNSLDEFNAHLRRHVEEFAALAKTAGIQAN